tara:strand:- start:53 stop:934 length:882 start_codon:yes stop_codon:yes gene_type:complete
MSKIKVDTIESSNQNIKLTPNGTGDVEVKGAGGADGTLKLNSSDGVNGVKLKSPPHSANQSQTLILPDNSPTQGDFLKVKSVTGTSPDKVAQLEYAVIPEPDITQLNASNITSGTVPAARFPSSLPGSAAALQLINFTQVVGLISYADITNLDDDSVYLIVLDSIWCQNSSSNGLGVRFLDSSGSPYTGSVHMGYYHYWGTYNYTSGTNMLEMYTGYSGDKFAYYVTVSTKGGNAWLQSSGMTLGLDSNHGRLYASFKPSAASNRIYGLRFTGNSWGGIESNSRIFTYKYLES